LNLAYWGGYTESLQRMGVECIYAPYCLTFEELIQSRGHEFDLIYITRYYVAENLIDPIRRYAPQAKIVLNNADLHFLRELREAMSKKSDELLAESMKTRDRELALMRNVDLVLSYNETEHAVILSHNLDSTRVALCPWMVEVKESVPDYEGRADIAFLGGYRHRPNVEAVEYFAREIMPLLRERLPGVRFLIYGSHVPREIEGLSADDIVIKGWVNDVADVYDTCRVFIAPLKSGAGLKGKVAGAMAHGVPCVLSPVAAEGLGVRDGLEARIAETPSEWVEAIVQVCADRESWERMSRCAQLFARQNFSFDRGRKLMKQALNTAGLFPAQENHALVLCRSSA
jgi:glycosyltransferase involved in cell wall biosynthesis